MTTSALARDEYEQLKQFVAYFANEFLNATNVPEQQRPLAVLEALEKSSRSKAERGLLMAVDDCIALTSSWQADQVSSVDAELKRRGIMPLSDLRRRYSKKYLGVLKRNKIRTEDEYYLVRSVLDDMVLFPGASESEKLVRLLNEYESHVAGRQRSRRT